MTMEQPLIDALTDAQRAVVDARASLVYWTAEAAEAAASQRQAQRDLARAVDAEHAALRALYPRPLDRRAS